jgi:predicted metal-dependent hydrolase
MSHPPPRLLPTQPFPEYSYVPGLWPRPRAPVAAEAAPLPTPEQWRSCEPFLFGIDLFNHGFYWEAHEEWESLWHAAGRKGLHADFFKGLIQLAVAGVKARQGMAEGMTAHARRGVELFEGLRDKAPPRFYGLSLDALIQIGREYEGLALEAVSADKVKVVCRSMLEPSD